MGGVDDLQQLGLVVGRVLTAEQQPGARAPSLLLSVDLGSEQAQATVPGGTYSADDVVGRQVVCLRDGDRLVVLGAHSHAKGLVLLRPDDEVEDGTAVA